MGVNLHVSAFRPPDEKWLQMKAVWDACQDAGIQPPEEVDEFFGYEEPDPQGVEINLSDRLEEYSGEMEFGFDLQVKDIPEGVTLLRFVASY